MKESQATKIVRAIIFENKNMLSINAVRPRVVNSKRVLKKKQQPKTVFETNQICQDQKGMKLGMVIRLSLE